MKPQSNSWLKVRVFIVFFFFFLAFILIFLRVFQLQVLSREKLQGIASRQHERATELRPRRGTIYDSNFVVLAQSVEIESLYARPRQIENPSETAKKIAKIIGKDWEVILGQLKSKAPFVYIQRKLSPEKVQRIRDHNLPGIHFLTESRRYYPNRALAAHLIGFVGTDPKGLGGVEYQYDRYLRGETLSVFRGRDAHGTEIITEPHLPPSDLPSSSLVLTIDSRIQYIVRDALLEAIEKTGALAGMVVVMEPQTGKVLAMASSPSFNPNNPLGSSSRARRNLPITENFEPGSVFKAFLLAAALEEGVVHWDELFFCHNGSFKIGRRTIHDHKKHGWLTLQKVIKLSSNIGASKIGFMLGAERFDDYIREFGFGTPTGIDLPGEESGIVRNPKTLSEVGLANSAFGHGISVTGIQLAAALSAIANGGTLMRPYVVDRIIDQNNRRIKSFEPEEKRRVISKETALQVTQILKQVVEEGGTGTKAAVEGYEVAGKTGTAQKIDPVSGRYVHNRYISSFMGYVPADDPALTIVVVIDEPRTGLPYGGLVAAPVFSEIARKTLRRLNIPPRQVVAEAEETAPNSKKE
jgi:cell division protein FtsI (penicillin-binding protein 3)